METEYPELDGLNELCKDMIENEEELKKIKELKNKHVKKHNWEIAVLYRELEKLLERGEPACSNCKFRLDAVGVGRGFICDINKLPIPSLKHGCKKHEYKN